jgi:hypothetical protein
MIHNDLLDADVREVEVPCNVVPGSYLFAKVIQLTPGSGGTHADDTWTAPLWFIKQSQDLIAGGSTPPSPGSGNAPAPAAATVINWQDAAAHVNQTVTVEGKVVRVHNHENRMLFINFSPNFRETLSLVIFADNFEDFDPFEGVDSLDDRLVGKTVRVKGKITTFQDSRMQMVIRSPSQIVSVEE